MKPFQVMVERIIPGGKGIAFVEKKAVFLPLVVPGDCVRVKQVADRGSYLEVLNSELVEASPDRQQPPCSYFGRCGGCDFQQMNIRSQLNNKAGILTDALLRVGRIGSTESRIIQHASPDSFYRNRVQLKVLTRNGTVSFGFYESASHRVVEVDRCQITQDALWAILPDLKTFLELSPMTVAHLIEVEIFQGDEEDSLIDLKVEPNVDNLSAFKRDLLAGGFDWGSRRVSLYISRSQKRTLRVLGPGYVQKTVGKCTYRVSRGSFFQVNDLMLESLSQRATHGLEGFRALDLFCGVGLFTLPLSMKFDLVWAVDQNASAVLDLKWNARTNGRRNCRIFHREVDSFLRDRYRDLEEVDLVLLDPPRSGIPKITVGRVADLKASKIVYVSCDPATLARDVAIFLGRGYALESLEIVDLFPQSHHVETVARLKRIGDDSAK